MQQRFYYIHVFLKRYWNDGDLVSSNVPFDPPTSPRVTQREVQLAVPVFYPRGWLSPLRPSSYPTALTPLEASGA